MGTLLRVTRNIPCGTSAPNGGATRLVGASLPGPILPGALGWGQDPDPHTGATPVPCSRRIGTGLPHAAEPRSRAGRVSGPIPVFPRGHLLLSLPCLSRAAEPVLSLAGGCACSCDLQSVSGE